MLPPPEGSQCVSVSHDTGSWPDVWPRTRFLRQGASCGGPHGPLGLGSVITVFGAVLKTFISFSKGLKSKELSNFQIFKITSCCPQRMRHEPSSPLAAGDVQCALLCLAQEPRLSSAQAWCPVWPGYWLYNWELGSQWAPAQIISMGRSLPLANRTIREENAQITML